jgi:hypothetical protein
VEQAIDFNEKAEISWVLELSEMERIERRD